MSLLKSDYRAPLWAPGGNLQTILPAEISIRPKVQYRREIWDTPDGDVVAVDWSTPEPQSSKAPVMVHFHGLEGSSRSHYAEALMARCSSSGVRGAVIHYRGCGGITNKKLRAYFAADAEELDWEFKRIRRMFPDAPIYAMGVSLGANNLLYWLGSKGREAAKYVDAAVSICSPLDLEKSSHKISKGFGKVYNWNFIRTLRDKALEKARLYPGVVNVEALKKVKTLYDFDEVFTSVVHGFKGAMDYWEKCSSLPLLPNIRVPTLVLNAVNDPVVGNEFLPKQSDASPFVALEYAPEGGHCGFPQGAFPGSLGYLPKRTFEFCSLDRK